MKMTHTNMKKKSLKRSMPLKYEALFRHFESNEKDLKYILKYGAFRLGIVFLFIFIVAHAASATSSENYAVNALVISGGGTNVSSTSYDINLLVGDIAGVTDSANYTAKLGFWFAEDYFPESIVWIISIVIALLGCIIWLVAWARKSEHKPIQLLFIFLAAFLSLAVINVASIFGEYDLSPMMSGVMWATIFSIAVIMIIVFLDTKLYKVKITGKRY
jgi:hypothetical protein